MENIITWDQRELGRGDRVRYASLNLWLDPKYHGVITDFASANIAYVRWDGSSTSIAEFISNLMLD